MVYDLKAELGATIVGNILLSDYVNKKNIEETVSSILKFMKKKHNWDNKIKDVLFYEFDNDPIIICDTELIKKIKLLKALKYEIIDEIISTLYSNLKKELNEFD